MKKIATKVIGSKVVKEHLKRAFGLADIEGYHFGGIKRRKKKEMMAAEATPPARPGTILILGIMDEYSF
eukprot:14907275-Ditylum_brightwellii.AAC.2